MQIATFKYTKANNVTSDRSVLVLAPAREHTMGIDISELSMEQQGEFAAAVSAAHEGYLRTLSNLMVDYDISKNTRQFDPKKMSNVTYENA